MPAERAGLGENLAAALALPVERITFKGSAAAVRTDLYPKTTNDAALIKSKKVAIWSFSARKFTQLYYPKWGKSSSGRKNWS